MGRAVGSSKVNRVFAEGLVQRVDGGEQPGASLLLISFEKIRGVFVGRQELVQDDAHLLGCAIPIFG